MFAEGRNLADVLTRRLEAYHEVAIPSHEPVESAPGTHDIERGLTLVDLPPLDRTTRALFLERMLATDVGTTALANGTAPAVVGWADRSLAWEVTNDGGRLRVALTDAADPAYRKTYRFTAAGLDAVEFAWGTSPDADRCFTTEVSHHGPIALEATPAADVWTYPIESVAKSERGLERALQGTATLRRWGASLGAARAIPTFHSYATEKKLSKHPEVFSHVAIEGVAGPEAA